MMSRIVGAILCFDASRLARNGRDWHHLLELCGLVDARVIDQDGVYNPCSPNDRLLLGMKGTISEFELALFARACSTLRVPRPEAENYASAFLLVISGTAMRALVSIRICACRKPSV